VLSGLARVVGLEFATLRIAWVFTKVECASFNDVVLVVGSGVGVLVVPDMLDWLHEASFRTAV